MHLVFVIELIVVLFIVVFILIVVIFVLVLVVLVVFVFVVHKNHPAFSIIVCFKRGDYSFYKGYKLNNFFAFSDVKLKICSGVVCLISAILAAVRFIIPE